MNKTWIIFLIFFLQLQLEAQEEFIPETTFGLKAGYNLSGVAFDPAVSQESKPGFVFGLAFKHISQKSLGVLVEINYTQLGWEQKFDSVYHYSRQLNYISLPFMTHITFGRRNFKVNINLGPYMGYLVSEQSSTNLDQQLTDSTYYSSPVKNKFNFGFCSGLGFQQKTRIGIFQIEGRYYLSLNNLYKQDDNIPFSSSKNHNIEFSLSYFIDMNKLFKN